VPLQLCSSLALFFHLRIYRIILQKGSIFSNSPRSSLYNSQSNYWNDGFEFQCQMIISVAEWHPSHRSSRWCGESHKARNCPPPDAVGAKAAAERRWPQTCRSQPTSSCLIGYDHFHGRTWTVGWKPNVIFLLCLSHNREYAIEQHAILTANLHRGWPVVFVAIKQSDACHVITSAPPCTARLPPKLPATARCHSPGTTRWHGQWHG
jgi:hypothetical protein